MRFIRLRAAVEGGGHACDLQPFADHLTAIIAVTDTGRSTGLARVIGGIPAPGDLRATLAAFATDPLMAQLLRDKVAVVTPVLDGGNILIAPPRDFNSLSEANVFS